MNNIWTAAKIVEATHGKLQGKNIWSGSTFSIDSRTLAKGDIFIAIKGADLDGHNFVAAAAEKGAIAAIVQDIQPNYPSNFPLVIVDNTDEALINLGKYARYHFKGKVIGITGSAGKTSTKDMLAFCLDDQAKTFKSEKSFNTKWGVPFTIANCPPDAEFLVLELGMSSPGEIANLTYVAQPHVAIVTMIGHAHLEYLKSVQAVATAKAEIFQGVVAGGAAIINGDLDQTDFLTNAAVNQGIENIFLFGEKESCHTRLLSYQPTLTGSAVKASILGTEISYSLKTFGKHHAMNSLAVLTSIAFLKADLHQAAQTIGAFTETDRRGKSYILKNNILLVDESYNANPDSMKAALLAFSERSIKGQSILVLGDMLELGPDSENYHRSLQNVLKTMKVDVLLTYGKAMKALHEEMKKIIPAFHFDDLETLSTYLIKIVKPNDGIFIKSSKSIKLNIIAEKMMEYYAV